jgi:hypothetical protein
MRAGKTLFTTRRVCSWNEWQMQRGKGYLPISEGLIAMKTKNPAPKRGAKGFSMAVMPERKYLDAAIEDNGFCEPSKCWHKLAIAAIVLAWAPKETAHVRIDAGHVKLNYGGWRYVADTPRHVKRSLMLFDKKRYDEVYIREYVLRFRRTTKIVPLTPARQQQINAARDARLAAGSNEDKRSYPNFRKRIEGFSGSV